MMGVSYVMEDGTDKEVMEQRWEVNIATVRKRSAWVSWNKPPPGYVKINTDGSFQNNGSTWELS